MALQRVDEMTEAPVVGRMYLVPCVHYLGDWWPVVGPVHEDADLGVAEQHLHYDHRFLCQRKRGGYTIEEHMWKVVRLDEATPQVVEHRRMLCKRVQPEFPVPRRQYAAHGFANHERRHLNMVAKGCKACPHRGVRLDVCPTDSDGGVVCPGHGLRWNRQTGKLMPRSLEVIHGL